MNGTIFLTTFLILGGAFTIWCSYKNYDWYFSEGGLSGFFILIVGREVARVFYVIIALWMLVWGAYRLINPPPKIPTDFVYALARPMGIELVPPKKAVIKLQKANKEIKDLVTDDGGWASFWIEIEKNEPSYVHALASSVAGPDFSEGFYLPNRIVGGHTIGGRIIYFNPQIEGCDNMLFSKKPLNSAIFVMVICTEDISKNFKDSNGLVVRFYRAGTSLFKDVTR